MDLAVGRGDRSMSKGLFDQEQVLGRIKQVTGERVPQTVEGDHFDPSILHDGP